MSCPPTKPAIAVITPNILIGLGLRTILEKVGPPGEIAVFDSFTEFIASGPERYFHYFAAMQVFMRHRTFFLENSHKTILLGKGIRPSSPECARSISSAAKNGWYTICCACAAKRLDPTMPFPGSTALRPPTCSPYAKRKC